VSDHFSGPRSMANPHGDITDVYAFPSPERPGNLVMAMNVHPNAPADAAFSDAMDFQLRVRPVNVATQVGQTGCFVVGDDEFTFRFHFASPTKRTTGARPLQVGSCVMPNGDEVNVTVDGEEAKEAGPRVFAGLRSDPFIFDLAAWQKMVSNRRVDFPEVGTNTVDGSNVLSIVVEVPSETMSKAGSLFAVVGETFVAGKLPVRLERVGRPEIKNITMGMQEYDTVNRDLDIRDLYNSEDAFHLGHGYLGAYRARLNANLAFWDSLDEDIAWPIDKDGTHPLTELLLQDFLVVDPSKPYSERSYFDIEMDALHRQTHSTCGGRSLNDNFIDTMYTVLINGGLGPRIHQGVDHAAAPGTRTFPYLASPSVGR
jgi:Domain of unknown function (DUF4331)